MKILLYLTFSTRKEILSKYERIEYLHQVLLTREETDEKCERDEKKRSQESGKYVFFQFSTHESHLVHKIVRILLLFPSRQVALSTSSDRRGILDPPLRYLFSKRSTTSKSMETHRLSLSIATRLFLYATSTHDLVLFSC